MGKMELSSEKIPMDTIPGIYPVKGGSNEQMYINS
jgi:hypothetical protein